MLLATLPTSKNHVPTKLDKEFGCVEVSEACINCFIIPANLKITTCGKCFDLRTHIYGYQLDTYEVSDLETLYQFEKVNYEVFGEMDPAIFSQLIDCLKNSKSVKYKHIRMLSK